MMQGWVSYGKRDDVYQCIEVSIPKLLLLICAALNVGDTACAF